MKATPRFLLTALLGVCTTILQPGGLNAQAPGLISFQGLLTDTSGVPIDDTSATLTLNLLNSSTTVWSEVQTGVDIDNGFFSVLLGSANPLTGYEFYEALRLEVEYKGETLKPGPPLTSAPYTMGFHLPILAEASVGGTALLVNNTAGAGDGIKGESNGSTGKGIYGQGSALVGQNYGVYGYSASEAGTGVYGLANTVLANAVNYGVHGKSNSNTGVGVYGEAPEVGVKGMATGGNVTDHGVDGRTTGAGLGVYGLASGSGTGVYGQNLGSGRAGHFEIDNVSNSDYALFAWTDGVGRAAHFEINNTNNGADGLHVKTNGNGHAATFEKTKATSATTALVAQTNGSGYALAATNSGTGGGIYGEADPAEGDAGHFVGSLFASESIETDGFIDGRNGSYVWGAVPTNSRVLFVSANGSGDGISVFNAGSGDGIVSTTSPAFGGGGGLAGYFLGDVHVGGDLTVSGTKDFKIDHPLDPANKYLIHFSVESDEVLNVYSGNVVTDASGRAEIELPDWFEALNRDFRYQLTVVGRFAQAIIGEKIHDNRFSIRTNEPNVEVSWQVTGVRHDPGLNALPVELDKPADKRGTYLRPDVYGSGTN